MDQTVSLFGTPREWAKDLATATVIGLFLGVIGPFGSFYGGQIELRIVHWVVNVWLGFIVLSTVSRLSIGTAYRFDLPVWFALAVGVALGSVPLGVLVALFSALFWPGNHGHVSPFFIWYGQTLAIAEPCSFAYFFLGRRGGFSSPAPSPLASALPVGVEQAEASVAPPAQGEGRFLGRLPSRLGRDLLALQMEDHYVRAHTPRGSDLILIPLKQAIAELGDIEGIQVHRSWWVARRAVAGSATTGRNLSLRLSNGLEAPVSRPSVAKLKAAGWIEPA